VISKTLAARKLASAIVATLAAGLPGTLALAQVAPAPPGGAGAGGHVVNAANEGFKGRTVEDVRIIGNNSVSAATIRNLIRTHEGDKFDPATVEEDYQRVYGLRKFANVEARVEPTATGVIVIFQVTEQKQIKSMVFRGNASVDSQILADTAEIKVGESIDRFRINLARQSIERMYKEKNHPCPRGGAGGGADQG